MTLPSRRWQDLTWTDFAALDPARTVAVLPVAAVEQHGPHLPLSVDADIVTGVLDRALELLPAELPVLALPVQAIGYSLEHSEFPGTLDQAPDTLLASWLAIALAVRRAGVRKLLILNSHGGQPQIAQLAIRELRGRHGMLAVAAATYGFGLPAGLFSIDEIVHGGHAGAVETAMMMHLKPELVRTDKLADFVSATRDFNRRHKALRYEGDVQTGWMTQDLNADGALGDATLANAETGARIIEHIAGRLALVLRELVEVPLDGLEAGPLGKR